MRKSRTKPALHVAPSATVQIPLPMQEVLADVKQAFMGLCIDVGKRVLAAMMEADRVAMRGQRGARSTTPGSTRRAHQQPVERGADQLVASALGH